MQKQKNNKKKKMTRIKDEYKFLKKKREGK